MEKRKNEVKILPLKTSVPLGRVLGLNEDLFVFHRLCTSSVDKSASEHTEDSSDSLIEPALFHSEYTRSHSDSLPART